MRNGKERRRWSKKSSISSSFDFCHSSFLRHLAFVICHFFAASFSNRATDFLQRKPVSVDRHRVSSRCQGADGAGGVFAIAALLRGQDLFQRNGLALQLQVQYPPPRRARPGWP